MHSTLSSGAVSRGFTSTAAPVASDNSFRPMNTAELRSELHAKVKRSKRKGYVSLVVEGAGFLNFELHCDICPKACDQFITFLKTADLPLVFNKRDGAAIASVAADNFQQERDSRLPAIEEGVLIMTSTELILVIDRAELDKSSKYTILGKVVGGRATLEGLKRSVNRALSVIETRIVEDPFESVPAIDALREAEEAHKRQTDLFVHLARTGDAMASHPNRHSDKIGKYIPDLRPPEHRSIPAVKPSKRRPFTFDTW